MSELLTSLGASRWHFPGRGAAPPPLGVDVEAPDDVEQPPPRGEREPVEDACSIGWPSVAGHCRGDSRCQCPDDDLPFGGVGHERIATRASTARYNGRSRQTADVEDALQAEPVCRRP